MEKQNREPNAGKGGDVIITGGAANEYGPGAPVELKAGDGGGGQPGGDLPITAGAGGSVIVFKVEGDGKKETPHIQPNGLEQALLAQMDDNGLKIAEIANNKTKSSEDRARLIIELDARFIGYNSEEWASLLGVKSGAVRKWDLWRDIQKAKKAD